MRPDGVISLAHTYFPAFLRQKEHADMLDPWGRGMQDPADLNVPGQTATSEYEDRADMARSPWLSLIITSLAQTIFLEGVRMPGESKNLESWRAWQENDFDEKQIPLYRAAFTHGTAAVVALPGRNRLTGDKTVLWTPRSARKMAVFFSDDDPEWPQLAIYADEQNLQGSFGNIEGGFAVRIYDDMAVHYLECKGNGLDLKDWTYITYDLHEVGLCPVVEYPNQTDLDGNAMGEVEPLIPLARRIDQDVFDRLIVQRYGAWKVRYVTGLVRPQGVTDEQYLATLKKLSVGDFLASDNKDTKFGQLDEMDLDRLIKAGDADLRTLSAVSQTPPHHMLGLSSNMQAESLAAATAGLTAKSHDRKTVFSTRHERLMRLTAKIMGNQTEMRAFDMQVRWKDMETRSLSQAADALGKLSTQVGVPQEMIFEMIPNWNDSDVQRALRLVQSGAVDKLMAELAAQAGQQPGGPNVLEPANQPVA